MAGFDSKKARRELAIDGQRYDYYSLPAAEALGLGAIAQLPYTLKVVLESVLRHHAQGRGSADDIYALAQWLDKRSSEREKSAHALTRYGTARTPGMT